MKKNQIEVGGTYLAKASGKLTKVRVHQIEEAPRFGSHRSGGTVYRVTNLSTGPTTMFRSAAKFRAPPNENFGQRLRPAHSQTRVETHPQSPHDCGLSAANA